ncbi:MAG: response regulator [Leptospirales bacterium]
MNTKLTSQQGEKKRILIIDDTAENIDILNSALKDTYRISVALNGQKALKIAASEKKPDLILLDVMMPGMDGYEVIERLKSDKISNGIPVIFITAMSEIEDEQKGFSLGAVDYIAKPFSIPIVTERVKTHIALKEYSDHLEDLVNQKTIELQKTNEAYERFVPKALIRYLKDDIISVQLGDAIEQNFHILFSDMRGFSAISEKFSPKEVMAFINSYLKVIAPIVKKHNGFIITYIGDAIMAAFPGDVTDIIECAVEMQDSLAKLNYDRILNNDIPIDIGIGINSGACMLGIIGEKDRLEGAIMSDVVNLSARVESLTKYYKTSVLLTHNTMDTIGNLEEFKRKYSVRIIDKVRVVGKTETVILYELLLDEKNNEKLLQSEQYEKAFNLYCAGHIQEAYDIFLKLHETNSKDYCLVIFIQRCEKLFDYDENNKISQVVLPEKFDGTTTLHAK